MAEKLWELVYFILEKKIAWEMDDNLREEIDRKILEMCKKGVDSGKERE